MDAWHFFANLYNTLITPTLAQLQAMLGAVCAQAQPVALALIAIWLVFSFFEIGNGTKTLSQFLKEGFIAALALTAIQVGQYTQWISAMVIDGVPNTIGNALGGYGSPVAALDNVLASTLTASLKTYEALPSYALKTIPLAIAIIICTGAAALSLCYAFGIYMIAVIINIAALVVGPIFVALAAIPQTRRFAAGWLSVLVGGCTTQLMALAVIQLLAGAEGIMIKGVVVTAVASNSNSIAMLWGLTQVALLLWLGKQVVCEIPGIARAIGGGVYHAASGITSLTYGAIAVAAGAALTAARAAATSGASGAGRAAGGGGMRSFAPAGASLSARKP